MARPQDTASASPSWAAPTPTWCCRVAHLPSPGETVLADGRRISPGGKGLNQAVAVARAGCRTRFVAALGADAEGASLREALADEDIDIAVRTADAPTGLAVVMVDAAGENSIVVVPGANAELCDLTTGELTAITDSTVLLMQLEIPLSTVTAAARAAKDAGSTVVLNAAPATALDDELLSCVDVLIVNEGEARALVASDTSPAEDDTRELDQLIDALLVRVPTVVVTLGAAGAVQRGRDGSRHTEPGRRVTRGRHDGRGRHVRRLSGGFAGCSDSAMPDAMRRATAAAALCVQRPGAVPAVPRHDEVDALLLDPLDSARRPT